jgi:hypothetical protein
MHRALQIAEMVEMICAQVAFDGPNDWWAGLPIQKYPRRRQDLSRLARTSTIFLSPALDALWSYQGTLLHLLRTMPNDLWDITETFYGEDEDEEETMGVKVVRFTAPYDKNSTDSMSGFAASRYQRRLGSLYLLFSPREI